MADQASKANKSSKANAIVGAVVAVVAIAAIVLAVMPRVLAGSPDGASAGASASDSASAAAGLRALVHDGDGATHELPLDQPGETAITTSLGTNVIVVEGGAVFVRDADCDNHDCIRQGRIDAPGSQIICLPHKLWIEVVAPGGQSAQMDPEAVSAAEGVDVTSR